MDVIIMIDLLYPNDSHFASSAKISHELLRLDDAFLYIATDIKSTHLFLDIICETATSANADTILYRQAILQDFYSSPRFLTELKCRFTLLSQLTADYNDFSGRIVDSGSPSSSKGSDSRLHTTATVMNMRAEYLEKALLLLSEIKSVFENNPFVSDGLRSLYASVAKCGGTEEFYKLCDLCHSLSEYSAEKNEIDLSVELNEYAKMISFSLLDIHPEKNTSDRKNSFWNFGGKQKTDNKTGTPSTISQYDSNAIIAAALKSVSSIFGSAIKFISKSFAEIEKALTFYETALKYISYLEESKINYIYPEILSNGKSEIFQLRDLYLLASSLDKKAVVPNDFIYGSAEASDSPQYGLLIRGENGSGKTVYLRSIASAYALAMSGLPITAQSAKITPKNIWLLFASSEKSLASSAADAGRFEEEVRDFAEILNKVTPDSLIILNEFFQTTSYDEGAEGLYYILRFLSDRGINWITVTHMHRLFDLFSNSPQVKKAFCDADTHKIIEIS